MARTTVRLVISEALEDLSENDFDRFCYALLDKPRVRRRAVQNKTFSQITDFLISTYTTAEAGKVALEILTLIDCNEVAKTLDSKIKAFGDNGDPTLRKTSDGKLALNPTEEAVKYAADQWPLKAARQGGPPVKKPKEVEAEAKTCVQSEGGDLNNKRLILSRYTIQFGKYKGQTFKWLLENDVKYVALLVASHKDEREHLTCQDPQMANKDSLTGYAIAYPDVANAISDHYSYHSAKDRSLKPGQKGKALVGFGKHRSMTLQDLYASKDKEIISYVNYLRSMKSKCDQGSKMDDAIKYILQRDRKKAAASTAAKRRATSSALPAAKKRTTSSALPATKKRTTTSALPATKKRTTTSALPAAKKRPTSSALPAAKKRTTSFALPAARKSQTKRKLVQSAGDRSTSASRPLKKKMKL